MSRWIIKPPKDYNPTVEDIRHASASVEAWASGEQRVIVLAPGWELIDTHKPPGALARLVWLLGLSEGERRFVMTLADNPQDEVTLAVFSDWLKEQGRFEDAAKLAGE